MSDHQQPTSNDSLPSVAENESSELQRTIHNDTVRLDANYLNSLSVWFAGAGSLGALTATFLAPLHNYGNAGVVAGVGVLFAAVLKWLANRTLRRLR
jgi:hypothetical protein